MPVKPNQRIVLVHTDDEFHDSVTDNGIEICVDTSEQEAAYEKLDDQLANHLNTMLAELFGKENDGKLYHQNLDWWPTCTRFLELDSVCITWQLIQRMQSLLADSFSDWRVNIHVYTPLDSDDSRHVGGLNIYSDWLLTQPPVRDLLS